MTLFITLIILAVIMSALTPYYPKPGRQALS